MRLATALTLATSTLAGCAGKPPARFGNVLTGGSDYFGSAAARTPGRPCQRGRHDLQHRHERHSGHRPGRGQGQRI